MSDQLILGFTGTRKGMSTKQQLQLGKLLGGWNADSIVLHHGDCLGSDEQVHHFVQSLNGLVRVNIVIHPPIDMKLRAYCGLGKDHRTVIEDNVRWWEPRGYHERDEDIVLMSRRMIATPDSYVEKMRGSGTWKTVRFARQYERPLYIIFPDGSVKEERT